MGNDLGDSKLLGFDNLAMIFILDKHPNYVFITNYSLIVNLLRNSRV
jgi:hypothetical protein